MATFAVKVGDAEYEVDAPDENTAWSWANAEHSGGNVMSGAGQFANDVRGGASSFVDSLNPKDLGVDYKSGLDALSRFGFGRMDTDAERKNYIEKSYGKGSFGQDSQGRFLVKPGAGNSLKQPTTVEDDDLTLTDTMDYGAAPAEIIGSMAGGLTGPARAAGLVASKIAPAGLKTLSKYLVPPSLRIAGSGLWAAVPSAADEAVEQAQGLNLEPLDDVKQRIKDKFVMGAALQVPFQAISPLARIPGLLREKSMTPERKAIVKEVIDMGFKPRTSQITGNIIGRGQNVTARIFGDPLEAQNADIMTGKINELRGRVVPSNDFDTGVKLQGRVDEHISNLKSSLGIAKDKVDAGLSESLRRIQAKVFSGKEPSDAIVADIKQAKRDFSDSFSPEYDKVNKMVGGKPVVNTVGVKRKLQSIAKSFPPDKEGNPIFAIPELRQFYNQYGELADTLTVPQAQQLRKVFRDAAQNKDMIPGFDKHVAGELEQAVSSAMYNIPGGKRASQYLEKVDARYAQGMKKFNHPTIAALTRDASMHGSVDPDMAVDYIVKPGMSTRLNRVLRLVTPETTAAIKNAHFNDLLSESKSLIDGADVVNGEKLYSRLKRLGPTLDTLYGKDAAAIRKYAGELAASQGKVDLSELGGGDILKSLRSATQKQRQYDDFMNKNFLSELSKPDAEATKAVDWIINPNSPERIQRAMKFLGPASKEAEMLRSRFVNKTLDELTVKYADPAKSEYLGSNMLKHLDKYGKETVDATLGKELSGELYKFARVAHFMTSAKKFDGQLAAAALAVHPIQNLPILMRLRVVSGLMNTDTGRRLLIDGMTGKEKITAEMLMKFPIYSSFIAEQNTSQKQ